MFVVWIEGETSDSGIAKYGRCSALCFRGDDGRGIPPVGLHFYENALVW